MHNNLVDSQQRSFSYLRLSITDLCNFQCAYCLPNGYQGKKTPDELSLREIDTLVSAFAHVGFKKIRLTGGEPSLRNDLLDIIDMCRAQSGIEKVCITSNGYQLDQQLPRWIEHGIDQVNISIDSLVPEHFELITSSSNLPTILRAIDDAIEHNFHAIKINTVLLNEHLDSQLLPLMDWVKDKPISLRFIELMQTGENTNFFNTQHVSAQIVRNLLTNKGWTQKVREMHAGPAEEFYHSDSMGSLGIIAPYSNNFCDSCNRLRVSAQGQLHLCLFAEHGLDIRHFLRTQDVLGLTEYLHATILTKPLQHHLDTQRTGAMKNFAMLGG